MTSSPAWLRNVTNGFFGPSRASRRSKRRAAAPRRRRLRAEWLESRYAPAGIDFAHAFGSDLNDLATAVDTDDEGNAFVAGRFQGTIDFDPGDEVVELASAFGSEDIFVARFSPTGELIWVVKAGAAGTDRANDIAVDVAGNVLVVGRFSGALDFDPSDGISVLTSGGGDDPFLWKLDSDGNFVFARHDAGNSINNDEGKAVAVNSSGEIHLLVNFSTVVNNGGQNVALAKYSPDGDRLYSREIGGAGDDDGNDLAVDASGNIFITGSFTQSPDFNPGLGVFKLTSAGGDDMFVTKLSRDGNFVWARRFGSSGTNLPDEGSALAVDSAGDVHVAGRFHGTVDFRPGKGVTNLTALGGLDVFVLKLTGRGDFVRVRQLRGSNTEEIRGLVLDAESNIYLTGSFAGTTDFDTSPATNNVFELTSSSIDAYVAKYDKNMSFQWALSLGGDGIDAGAAIATTPQSAVCVVGHFSRDADFDPGNDNLDLVAAGNFDAFVWQMPQQLSVEISQDHEHLLLRVFFGGSLELRDFDTGEVLETMPLETAMSVSITGDSSSTVQTLTIDFGAFGFLALPQGISIDAGVLNLEILGNDETVFGVLPTDEHSGQITALDPVNSGGITGPSTFIDYQSVFDGLQFAAAGKLTLVTPFSRDSIEIGSGSTDEGVTVLGSSDDGLAGGEATALPTISFRDVTIFVLDSARHDRPTVPSNDHIQLHDGALNAPGLRDAAFLTGAGNDILLVQTLNLAPPVPGGVVRYDGGAGSDQVDAEVDADMTLTSTSLTLAGAGQGTVQHIGVERANLTGGPSDNVLSAKAFSGTAFLSGDAGNDLLVSGKAFGSLEGGSGDDILRGDAGSDFLDGGSGDDTIDAGSGNNIVDGGTGDDRLTAGRGSDTITGGDGNDIISAGDGNNSVDAGDGQDSVATGSGNDSISTGEGDDRIGSGAGNDEIDAGEGDDQIDAGTGDDIIFAGGLR